jgi:hypothetical protein
VSWRNVHLGQEGDALHIGGLAVWQNEWRWQDGKTIYLPHPLETAQTYSYMICEAGPRNNPVRFAAAEMPNRLWAFYVQD